MAQAEVVEAKSYDALWPNLVDCLSLRLEVWNRLVGIIYNFLRLIEENAQEKSR